MAGLTRGTISGQVSARGGGRLREEPSAAEARRARTRTSSARRTRHGATSGHGSPGVRTNYPSGSRNSTSARRRSARSPRGCARSSRTSRSSTPAAPRRCSRRSSRQRTSIAMGASSSSFEDTKQARSAKDLVRAAFAGAAHVVLLFIRGIEGSRRRGKQVLQRAAEPVLRQEAGALGDDSPISGEEHRRRHPQYGERTRRILGGIGCRIADIELVQ